MKNQENKNPKGKLIIIGGNEAKKEEKKLSDDNNQNIDFRNGVLQEVIKEMNLDPVIEIISVASKDQEEMGKKYLDAFTKLKQNANVMIIKNKKDVNSPENLKRIEEANIVFFTGGDQVKIHDTIADTQFLKILKNKYENEEFIIAGTSSGAMVMAESMIISGDGDEAVLKGVIETQQGLGLISNVIIDTHFLSRGRIARLAESILRNNQDIGVGICEDTGVVVTDGRYLRAIGSGTVVIMEGRNNKKYKL